MVSDAILRRDSFRWWQFNYLAMRQYRSPEPMAGDRGVGGQPAGVYLSWTLPSALRHGIADPVTGEVAYPLVPNRWLVLRLSGTSPRQATGWVLESDCPYTTASRQVGVERTSMYLPDQATITAWKASPDRYRSGVTLNPAATEPQVANIGIPFPLAQGWTERAPGAMFLTAVAPGNPVFAAYAPHNLGVFTFIDDLAGLSPPGPQPLSYLVAGWYSDPAGDILASWQHEVGQADPYQALLDRLGWTVAGPPGAGSATRSYFTGRAADVIWDPAQAPASDPLEQIRSSGQLDVAVGNTAEDAFIALVGGRLGAAGHPASTTARLRAFLYGLLPLANQPGGDALVQRAITARWFGAHAAGYRWVVTSADAAADQATGGREPTAPAWLDRLNADQRELDQAVAALQAVQWDLNAMWSKRGRYPYDSFPDPPPGVDSIDLLDAQLDPDQPGSLAARLLAAIGRVQAAAQAVPQPADGQAGTPQEAFERGVADFAAARGLPAGQVLKAVPAEPYWQAANPVVMLSGVEASQEASSEQAVQVRPGTGLATAVSAGDRVIDETAARAAVPAPAGLAALPALAGPILTDFVLTDPGSAAALASAAGLPADVVAAAITAHDQASYAGLLPSLGLGSWSQPWRPLLIEWQLRYTDVPQPSAAGPWTFDGTDYRCGAGAAAGVSATVGGVCVVGPHAPSVFRERLAEFVVQYGSESDIAHLDEWIGQVSGWRFLSQELAGLGQLLTARDQRPFRRPRTGERVGTAQQYPLADILGYPGANSGTSASVPDRFRGAVTSVPYLPAGTDAPFVGLRQGQAVFSQLIVYDRFGRVLPVILPGSQSGLYSAQNFPLVTDQALTPDVKLDPRVAAPVQLPPRLLQPARCDFMLLDAATGTDSDLMAAANPIGGWVLPNHLDHALLLYAPDGTALGEIRTVVSVSGARVTSWTPPPHSTVRTPADVAARAPVVAGLIGAPVLASQSGFDAFLEVIDSTLWTTDPLGSRADQQLSVLIGRPLALVRARIGIKLAGPPITDCGWAATLDPPVPAFAAQEFAVRLGDQATRDDGLIGYFAGGDMAAFDSVAAPSAPAAGIRQIGAALPDGTVNWLRLRCGSRPDTGTEVAMLLDPRGSVHATTGILPVRTVAVRPDLVSAALSRLEVSFGVGAALTAIAPAEAPAGQRAPFPEAVAFPPPAENQGTWSWWQSGTPAGTWSGYAVTDPGTDAVLRPVPSLLADGVLQLVIDLTNPG